MEKLFDCHVHYTEMRADEIEKIILTSRFRQKYRLYSELDVSSVRIETLMRENAASFVFPLVLKEINIDLANKSLIRFAGNCEAEAFFFPLINDKDDDYSDCDFVLGMKEHFLLHNAFDHNERRKGYDWLNNHNKLLILHCHDRIRNDYISYLHERYPDMYIQIAHLGINRANLSETYKLWSKFSGDNHIFFDLSTVDDIDLIKNSFAIINNEQILYGSDTPYYRNRQIQLERVLRGSKITCVNELLNDNAKKLVDILKIKN